MKRFKNILVATDTRLEEHPIVSEAAEIALHNEASLTIVDVVSGIRLDRPIDVDGPRARP